MSLEERKWVVNHPHAHFFNKASNHADILDEHKTQTNLIEMIVDLLKKNHIIYFTAINSDHHDDSALGLHCHHNGYAFDCWPMKSDKSGDYFDVDSSGFLSFLHDASTDVNYYQIGLTPDCYTPAAIAVSGNNVYMDDGASHIHLGIV
jgi:hypothetical protein